MMKRLLLGFAFSASLVAAADVTVGTATARPGQKATGNLQIPAGSDVAVDIPVIVINGAKPGPTLALLSGAHGTEYASIIALEKLISSRDFPDLAGALIVVPLFNVAAFRQVTPHLNPIDGKNMNRPYPGKPDGTQSERAVWAVTRQILEKCDYLIDYHGGDLDENLRRYSYWADTGNQKIDSVSRGMVLAFGLDHIIIQKNPGAMLTPNGPNTITKMAQNLGKPSIAVEAGHAGTTAAADIDVLVDGTVSVMRHLKMLPGEPMKVSHPLWLGNAVNVPSEHDGIFYSVVTPEAFVEKGMLLGYVTDYFGVKIAGVVSPISGVVIYVRAVPSLKKGDNLAYIGEVTSPSR